MSDTVATYPADLHTSAIPDPESDTPAQTEEFWPQEITTLHEVATINWLKFKPYHLQKP